MVPPPPPPPSDCLSRLYREKKDSERGKDGGHTIPSVKVEGVDGVVAKAKSKIPSPQNKNKRRSLERVVEGGEGMSVKQGGREVEGRGRRGGVGVGVGGVGVGM